ncbi:MAG: DUF917 domain-containing protein [Chlamydiales bacterium]|nr:DUF917 domain-containing protein [Chlamydiales bacterium]
MRQLTIDDLEALALGSAILGSGGGGDPTNEVIMARYAIEQFGPVTLISIDDLQSEDLVLPIGLMGAPLVSTEKLPNSQELLQLVLTAERVFGRKPTALMAGEIGGANAFCPLLIAGSLGLPVLDADLIGRAFPQLQMSSAELMGISCCPAILSDCCGNTITIDATNALEMERLARHVTVAMGSSCAVALYSMSGKEARVATVPGTVSQAISIGRTIIKARTTSSDPVRALLETTAGSLLAQGTITDVNQSVKAGFLEGTVKLDDVELIYQNEYLLARRGSETLGCTPDILMLMETDSGTPITSESLRYGLRVSLVRLPSPKIWTTPEGLALVGPKAFGFT